MRISYQYKNYPGGSKKLMNKSRMLGYYTGTAMFLVYALFWVCIVAALLEAVGLEYEIGMWVAIASCVLLHRLVKLWRESGYKKLDERYRRELEQLRCSDPQQFLQIMQQLRNG